MAPKSTSPHRLEMASPSMDSDDVSPRKLSAISLDDKYNDNEGDDENDADMKPLLKVPDGSFDEDGNQISVASKKSALLCCGIAMPCRNVEFWQQAKTFCICFFGLMASYLTWGYMQELIMTSTFNPTGRAPDGKFPSATFCVFSNRLLAVVVAVIMVRWRHGAVFANNTAPLYAFCPPALSNTMSSWSQYAALKFVTFPEQTVFKSSKIIAVMLMGKVLQQKTYPWSQYIEAILITIGVIIFSFASKEGAGDRDNHTELIGLVFLVMYISFDSFTAQYQDKVYQQYGRDHVDPYQMMLGVNVTAIAMTTFGLVVSGDVPIVWEFLLANPNAAWYNLLTAITSASGQICIFYTIQQFGPIIFTIIMTTRQMLSICLSTVVFRHTLSAKALVGAVIVFGVVLDRIRRKYQSSIEKQQKVEQVNKKDEANHGGNTTAAINEANNNKY